MYSKTKLISNNTGILPTIILLLIFNYSFLFNNCFSQWIQQTSGVNATLYDIEMVNENTGWICGVGGTILKTTNGGKNWLSVPNSAVGKPLFDIDIVDESTMYCVGWFETILKSTNAGSNWFAIRNGPVGGTASYYTCSFINKDTGWICGDLQKILRTKDGGITFDSTYIFVADMFHIYFKNPLEGLVTGEGSIVKRSTDGGYNWIRENINPLSITRLRFVNDTIGWVVGTQGRVFKTTTGGEPIVGISNNTALIENFELKQNYPNPFNNSTNLEYSIDRSGYYKLEIFDIQGRLVRELFSSFKEVGKYKIRFEGNTLSSGIYFYRLSSILNSQTKKFLLIS